MTTEYWYFEHVTMMSRSLYGFTIINLDVDRSEFFYKTTNRSYFILNSRDKKHLLFTTSSYIGIGDIDYKNHTVTFNYSIKKNIEETTSGHDILEYLAKNNVKTFNDVKILGKLEQLHG